MGEVRAERTRAGRPTNDSVCARRPELPGLAVLLDPDRLGVVVSQGWPGTSYTVDRLRLKSDSVTAALRPAGPGRWLLVNAWSTRVGEHKLAKDRRYAGRHEIPWLYDDDSRLYVATASADRRLPELARFDPDSGRAGPAGAGASATTLSYNPRRRWVGALAREGVNTASVRIGGTDVPTLTPWVEGRAWVPSDGREEAFEALRRALTQRSARHGHPCGRAGDLDLAPALHAAVTSLAAIHRAWGRRGGAVLSSLAPVLALVPWAPAHGDFSPDQVIVTPEAIAVLDWDRFGRWPVGWDEASWDCSIVAGGEGARGVTSDRLAARAADPVRAAAALLRTPEPFRRQRPDWASRTEALLAMAEDASGLRS